MKASEQDFMPGLELCRRFYEEAVAPILASEFAELRYSVARLGAGSEVLGYDTKRSTDHDWGPRLQLFLDDGDFQTLKEPIDEMLRMRLPKQVQGYSTHFGPADEEGTRLLAGTDGPVNHRVEIYTIPGFFENYMGYDPGEDPAPLAWLTWPQQLLLGVTAGAVYWDALGELTIIRQKLSYYPRDVWLYLLAAQWHRIGQEEHFVGRTGEVGDELGSSLLAARLVHDLMQLGFLMERTYCPYPKWFGSAFARLNIADALAPILNRVVNATNWHEREEQLCLAYEVVASRHNTLGITEPLETNVRYFHGRPFRIIDAARFAKALLAQIEDPIVTGISTEIGSIDQFSHSTDLRSEPRLHKRLQSLYK